MAFSINDSVIEPLINFLRQLFTQENNIHIDENGERVMIKKPLRMVFLSLSLLCTFIFIFCFVLLYKLAIELMDRAELLELIFKQECESEEKRESCAMNSNTTHV